MVLVGGALVMSHSGGPLGEKGAGPSDGGLDDLGFESGRHCFAVTQPDDVISYCDCPCSRTTSN